MTQLPMQRPPTFGLLTPQDRQAALWSGLLNLGGGLMAAGAPTTDPGQGQRLMGQAVQNFGGTLDAQLQQARQNALVNERVQAERAKRARAEEMRKNLPGLLQNLTPDQRAVVSQMEPEAAYGLLAKEAFKGPQERKTIKGADGYNYYVDTGERVLPGVEAAPKRDLFTVQRGDQTFTYIGDKADPTTWVEQSSAPRYKPNTNVTVNSNGPGEFAKAAGKSDAAMRESVLGAGEAAEASLSRVRSMSAMLPTIGTGPVASKMPGLQAFFGDLGLDVSATAQRLGIDIQDVGNAEEFDRLSRELSTEALGNFKGATSNRELDFARGTVANLGKSEEGNARALATMEVMAERAQNYASKLLEMERESGATQETFNQWRQWRDEQSRVNPIDREVASRTKAALDARPKDPGANPYKTKYGLE